MHVLRVLDAIALQRTEIVSIPKLCEQILENGPVPITTSGSVLVLEMGFDIGLDVIVVEKRIVDIDQEDDLIYRSYPYATSRTKLSVRLSRTQMLQHADASALCPSDCRRQISGHRNRWQPISTCHAPKPDYRLLRDHVHSQVC